MNRLPWMLLLLPLAGCGEKAAPPAPPARTVLAFQVHLGSGSSQADYSGEVRPRHEAGLGFRVAGKLIERRVDVGDRVAPGQVLARLDPADLAQSLKGAEAQLAAAEAERALARAEVERYRGLRAQQFVSQAALDAREAALKAAEEKVRATAAQGVIARNQAGYAVLGSDTAGVVSAVLAEAGQVVAAGQAVVRVARTDEKEVLIALPENRVAELESTAPGSGKASEPPPEGAKSFLGRPGERLVAGEVAVVLWAAPDKRYRGRVREVAPQADPVTRTYAARVSILNADAEVRLGQTARVLLKNPTGEATTLIPLGSVFQQGRQPAVWLIGSDGRVHLHPIKVAAWREDGVAVAGGLAEGERIVAAGAHKLVEGEAVRVAEGGRP